MDFQQLLSKMRDLDQPAVEPQIAEQPVVADECGGPMDSPMAPNMSKPDTPPPSMSINLNAQGLDNIEELMSLIKAVNKDMDKPTLPSMSMEPTIAAIKPSMPPLKMLPDLDAEEPPHMEPDGDEGPEPMNPDLDKDGDSEKEKKDKEETFGNSVNDSEPNTMDMDAAIPDGNDLHKQKKGFRAAAGGDNPMNTESTDLRAQIRAELLQRLAEAKGAK